jgi:hypothetical protein
VIILHESSTQLGFCSVPIAGFCLTSSSFNDVLIKVVGGTETCSEMSTTYQTFAAVDIVFPYFQCGKKINLRIGQLKLRILKTVPQHFSIWHFAAHPLALSP